MKKLTPTSDFKLRKVIVTRFTKATTTLGAPSTSVINTVTSISY